MSIPQHFPVFEEEKETMNLYKDILLSNEVLYPIVTIEGVHIYFPSKTDYLKTFLTEKEINRANILYGRLIGKGYLLLLQSDNEYTTKELIENGYMENCFLSVFKDDWDSIPDYFKQDYKVLDKNEVIQSLFN